MILAIADRAMRIEVGRGLEGDVPDVIAHRMIDAAKPLLRGQDYDGAILQTVDLLRQQVGGEALSLDTPVDRTKSRQSPPFLLIILVLFFC